MIGGTFYILQSKETNKFYIGSTKDLEKRLQDHARGNTKTTRIHKPWILVYTENFETHTEARKREYQIKKWKNHTRIQALIDRSAGRAVPTL